ncbi:TenA family transcriptional regulator [Rhodococcus sp. 06-235-1A]|uniref:TenA family protein n=1 Tax=Rhodococcus sp. 06-235-1A TaxID=2022508 RepID=UPI000B9C5D29|nr:TenA family protein [Rhodococcus sp. 06-235-1A]OZD08696.1 TenA family transcriptional regulator [Rhodococcus sp. 06-235-1A]
MTPVVSADPVRFTDLLWNASENIRRAIVDLEFLRLLGAGTLPLDAFRRYLEQDSLYLGGYVKSLSLLAAHAPGPVAGAFWASAASSAMDEAASHEAMLTGGALPPSTEVPEPSPACLGYTSYLTATAATEPYPVAAAAVLPCFWIYADVGRSLADAAKTVLDREPEHPYAQWVAAYDAPEFHAIVDAAKTFVDDAAAAATPAQREQMIDAFVVASRYELMFWDSALHPTPWPLAENAVYA